MYMSVECRCTWMKSFGVSNHNAPGQGRSFPRSLSHVISHEIAITTLLPEEVPNDQLPRLPVVLLPPLVLLATVGLPAAAFAQYRLPTIVSANKADSLHDSAVQFAQTGRWEEAARLYRRSAEFRAVEDPIGLQCLMDAAAVAYAAGDRSAARSDMAHAAERALARGDIEVSGDGVSRRGLDRAGTEEAGSGLGAGATVPRYWPPRRS